MTNLLKRIFKKNQITMSPDEVMNALDNKSRELKELNKCLQKMLEDLEKTEEGI